MNTDQARELLATIAVQLGVTLGGDDAASRPAVTVPSGFARWLTSPGGPAWKRRAEEDLNWTTSLRPPITGG